MRFRSWGALGAFAVLGALMLRPCQASGGCARGLEAREAGEPTSFRLAEPPVVPTRAALPT